MITKMSNALVNFMPPPPPPPEVGEYRGFEKSWCQIPHYWGQNQLSNPHYVPTPIVGDLTTPQE